MPVATRIHVPSAELGEERIAPELVLEGAPAAADLVVRASSDGSSVRGVWEVTPGRFEHLAEGDETLAIVSGEATIEPEWDDSFDIGPGDLCILEPGHRSVWSVRRTVRLIYHVAYVDEPG
jgi:uncharacterized protein